MSRVSRSEVRVPAWLVLVYRVPSEPASRRVAVWRDLKRLGALYLQQCVCILPRLAKVPDELEHVTRRIVALDGEFTLFDVPRLRAADEARVRGAFRDLRNKEYAEIVEECETKFVKEVEFERFRENYTFEEAEEIEQDLDKIRRWFEAVKRRDWFAAGGADEVAAWLARCRDLLADFEEEVYRRVGSDAPPDVTPQVLPEPLRPIALRQPRRTETSQRRPRKLRKEPSGA